MITYVVKPKKNPQTGLVKYYAQVAPTKPIFLDAITEKIANESTVTEHDVKAVLSALQEQVLLSLREGQTLRLGDLGSFRLTIKSKGKATAKEVTPDDVERLRVRYTMSSRLRSALAKGQRGIAFSLPYTPKPKQTTGDEKPGA